MERREPSYTVSGNVNWYSHYGEQGMEFLKKLKIEWPYDPEIPLLGTYTEKTMVWKDTCTTVVILVLFTITKTCMRVWVLSNFSRVQLSVTLWTISHQVPLPWGSPGKNTGVGCQALLQGIFLTQGSNLCLLVSCTDKRVLYPAKLIYSVTVPSLNHNSLPQTPIPTLAWWLRVLEICFLFTDLDLKPTS